MPPRTVIACCILHTICMDMNDEFDPDDNSDDDDDDDDDNNHQPNARGHCVREAIHTPL